jgi:GTP cyclohydrolase IA
VTPGLAAGQSLHLARDNGDVDVAAARRAAADFLSALGIDLDREDLRETPARMARAYAELFSARPLRLTTFANAAGYDELVLARAIPFRTVCEHHLLPFSGLAHVGYLPGERIVGLSKLARLVEHFAARPQVQERLTKQVAECLATRLRARGVGVVLGAEHSCMTLRGVAGARREDDHFGPAGHAAGRPAQPGRVLRPGRRAALRANH